MKISIFDIEKKGDELATMLAVYAEQNNLHTSVTSDIATEQDSNETYTFHVQERTMILYSIPVTHDWVYNKENRISKFMYG